MTKLARLQSDMNYVREHIKDITLTEDDLEVIEEARKDFGEGKTRVVVNSNVFCRSFSTCSKISR